MAFFADNLNALPVAHSFGAVRDNCTPTGLFYCAQKHGAIVIEVGEEETAGTIAGDAVFTRTGRPIGIVTADCLPILIASQTDEFVAAIHGGWQGLAAGIIENSFSTFRHAGVSLGGLRVAFGPSIQSCCYEVGAQLVDKIEQIHGHLWCGRSAPWSREPQRSKLVDSGLRAPVCHGEAWLDLPMYCFYLLEAEGLDGMQTQTTGICTYCSGQDWGSYRRRTHRVEQKTYQYSWIYRKE